MDQIIDPIRTAQWSNSCRTSLLSEISLLLQHVIQGSKPAAEPSSLDSSNPAFQNNLVDTLQTQPSRFLQHPSPLDQLQNQFGLSTFERNILVFCAGVEMDQGILQLCNERSQAQSGYPTLSFILSCLPGATFDVLNPSSTLIRWQLIQLDLNGPLTSSPVRIDRWVFHFLMGHQPEESDFAQLRTQRLATPSVMMSDSHQKLLERVIRLWSDGTTSQQSPIIQMCGSELSAKQAIVLEACRLQGWTLHTHYAERFPNNPALIPNWCLQWHRQAYLNRYALFLECGDPSQLNPVHLDAIIHLMETLTTPLFLSTTERFPRQQAPIFTLDISSLNPDEQRQLWVHYLGSIASQLDGQLSMLVTQFNLSADMIQSICNQVSVLDTQEDPAENLTRQLWNLCRTQSRTQLEGLAELSKATTNWHDLVLPQEVTDTLKQIIAMVRSRGIVFGEWGMAGNSRRGMGITSMFYGPPGTGKTTAAELIATDLDLDLYRIDLSQMVSKYIGETEKNLAKIFDSAEKSSAILLFDEADSIIGKRSEVKESRDRYANQEVSYLLQRMEAYPGLAIMTTNLPTAIDPAFMRRIKFSIKFEFPNGEQRAEIWRRAFPPKVPKEGLQLHRLAQLNVSGANIRNIALATAFLAADEQQPIQMRHVLEAARREMKKQGRTLSDNEVRGWI